MAIVYKANVISDVGLRRKQNQDNFYFNGTIKELAKDRDHIYAEKHSGFSIFAVLDGMGGEHLGAEASYTVADAFKRKNKDIESIVKSSQDDKEISKKLSKLVNDISYEVVKLAEAHKVNTSGSTGVIAIIAESSIYTISIGDSDIFIVRDNELTQLNEKDISMFAPAGKKAGITQFFGANKEGYVVVPHIKVFEPKKGDRIILSSDGLSDMVDTSTIEKLACEKDLDLFTKNSLNEALQNGGNDNITILSIDILSVNDDDTGLIDKSEIEEKKRAAISRGQAKAKAKGDNSRVQKKGKSSSFLGGLSIFMVVLVGLATFYLWKESLTTKDEINKITQQVEIFSKDLDKKVEDLDKKVDDLKEKIDAIDDKGLNNESQEESQTEENQEDDKSNIIEKLNIQTKQNNETIRKISDELDKIKEEVKQLKNEADNVE